ncbi:transcription repressor OFP7-like [Quercus lobata]|uniref:Transcription repressor n=1 Tax=Quercus lobata TaxID=97700 RepID=A0A7N2KSA4_QUELO|nr:transcription repressor OFP7-like [Quercus lobata]
MAKRFKLKFPFFHFCRPKHLLTLSVNPSPPAIYRLSPVNPTAQDIIYPSLKAPPSTPEHTSPPSNNRHVSSNTVSVGCGCRLKPCTQYRSITGSSSSSPAECTWKKETLVSTKDCSNEFVSESLVSVSEKCKEKEISKSDEVKKGRKLRRYALESECSGVRGNGKVRESHAVVKKTENPYEDFKRSMLEMILEKQMFETTDLEELLHCFLSLNSRVHHGVIVEAFSEIWEILFCDSPEDNRASFGLQAKS